MYATNPQDLKHTMAGLLRLHMSLSNEALGDEQVLAVYPTTIRRCGLACIQGVGVLLKTVLQGPLHSYV
jgi:hypothetical protein